MTETPPVPGTPVAVKPVTGRLVWGLVLLAVGVLFTLDNLGIAEASHILRWWPLLALAWGVMCWFGLGCRCKPVVGGLWLVIGTVALLHNLDLVRLSLEDLFPLFLIVAGGAIVLRSFRRSRRRDAGAGPASGPGGAGGGGGDVTQINLFSFLHGSERKIVTPAFAGGEASAILGGLTLDLRGSSLAGGRAVVDVFAMWGGIELILPAGWRVVGRVSPLLGAYLDAMPPVTDPAAPTLELRGIALMGGVDVRSDDSRRMRLRRAIVGAHVGPGIHVGVTGLRRGDATDRADEE
jgi:hypothetical protein